MSWSFFGGSSVSEPRRAHIQPTHYIASRGAIPLAREVNQDRGGVYLEGPGIDNVELNDGIILKGSPREDSISGDQYYSEFEVYERGGHRHNEWQRKAVLISSPEVVEDLLISQDLPQIYLAILAPRALAPDKDPRLLLFGKSDKSGYPFKPAFSVPESGLRRISQVKSRSYLNHWATLYKGQGIGKKRKVEPVLRRLGIRPTDVGRIAILTEDDFLPRGLAVPTVLDLLALERGWQGHIQMEPDKSALDDILRREMKIAGFHGVI